MKRKGGIKRTASTSKKRSSTSSSVSKRRGFSSLANLEVQLGKASIRQQSSAGLVARVMDFGSSEEAHGDTVDADPVANVDCILSQDFFW